MKKTISMVLPCIIASFLWAQEVPSDLLVSADTDLTRDIDAIAEASELREEVVIPEDTIDNRISHWLNGEIWENGAWIPDPNPVNGASISAQITKNGGSIQSAFELINCDVIDPEFGKKRTMAFARAINAAKTQYLLEQRTIIQSELLSKLFANDSTPEIPTYKKDSPSSQEEALYKKMLALGEAKLDKALEELGVDKEEFSKQDEAQKETTLQQSLTKKTAILSFGNLAGFMPIQSFEGFIFDPITKKKVYAVGVISSITPQSKLFAKQMRLGQSVPHSPKKGLNLPKYFRENEKGLMDVFGIRRYKDENGNPVVVAFGQWSSAVQSGNARKNIAATQRALEQAKVEAKAELSFFMDSNFSYSEESEVGEYYEEAMKVNPDSSVEDATESRIIDIMQSSLRGKTKTNLQGSKVLHTWNRPHPQNPRITICGAVVAWSPAWRDNLKKEASPAKAALPQPTSNANPASSQSHMDMELEDF